MKQASLSSWVWKGAGKPSLFWFAVEIAIIVANSSPDTCTEFEEKPDLVIVVVVKRNLAIAVGVRSLEALPAEPVDLLVALRSSVSHLRSGAQGTDP